MSDKRTDYLSWDEYFMGVAMLPGMRSKDPNTQVGWQELKKLFMIATNTRIQRE